MLVERRIKELSFALEALSRVNSYLSSEMHSSVENLLIEEIEVAKREQKERAETANLEQVYATSQGNKAEPADEIPF